LNGWVREPCVLLPKSDLDYLVLLTFLALTSRCESRVLSLTCTTDKPLTI
jgi:hypothetical protein